MRTLSAPFNSLQPRPVLFVQPNNETLALLLSLPKEINL
jgi:hypothetical protein